LMLFWMVFFLGCVQSGENPVVNETIEDVISVSEPQATTTTTLVATTSSTSIATTTVIVTSTSTTSTSTTLSVASGNVRVVIYNHSFVPENLTIRVDTIVTWVNNDSSEHQIISDLGYAGGSGVFRGRYST